MFRSKYVVKMKNYEKVYTNEKKQIKLMKRHRGKLMEMLRSVFRGHRRSGQDLHKVKGLLETLGYKLN